MDWGDIAETAVSLGAPLLGSVLAGPAGAKAGTIIASLLGSNDDPDSVLQAMQGDGVADKIKLLEAENAAQLRTLSLEGEIRNISEVNRTMRQEINSKRPYIRNARPTALYGATFSCIFMVLIAGFVLLADTSKISALATLFQYIIWPITALCAIGGVYVNKRSHDKHVEAGHAPPQGILQQFIGRLGGK